MLPLLIPVIVTAAIAIISTGVGVAVSNWTSHPTTTVNNPQDDVYTNTAQSSSGGINISNTTLLIAGLAIAAVFILRK